MIKSFKWQAGATRIPAGPWYTNRERGGLSVQLFTRSQPSRAESATCTGNTALLQHSVRWVRPALHQRVEGSRCHKSLYVLSSGSRHFWRMTIVPCASRLDDSEAC